MRPISSVLSEFVEMDLDPGYAVMLDGSWGSGKTWDIKQLFSFYENTDRKTYYVSLNGLSSADQISSLLYSEMHPKLGGKAAKIGQKLAHIVLRSALKVDPKDWSDVFKEECELKKPCILVFDDFERVGMPVKEVLGYIARYVDNIFARVIIVGNESEINDKNEYFLAKEKVIGRTFKSFPNLEGAYSVFLSEIKNAKIRSYLLDNKRIILEAFKLSDSNNLRVLRYAILEWASFVGVASLEQHLERLKDFSKVFFPICFEYKLGHIVKGDLEVFQSFSGTTGVDEPKCSKVMSKYQNIHRYLLILAPQSWDDFFGGGVINSSEIQVYLSTLEGSDSKSTPAWIKGWEYRSMSNHEIELLRAELEKHLFCQAMVNPGEYLHSAGIYLGLSNDGLLRVAPAKIKEKIIKRLKSDQLKIDWRGFGPIFMLRDAYAGRGYISATMNEFQEIFSQVESLRSTWASREKFEKLKEAFASLRDDPNSFFKLIGVVNGEFGPLHYEPILHHIKPSAIVEYISMAPFEDVRVLIWQIDTRYSASNHTLSSEVKWLEAVKKSVIIKGRKMRGIERVRLEKYYSMWLESVIEKAKRPMLT